MHFNYVLVSGCFFWFFLLHFYIMVCLFIYHSVAHETNLACETYIILACVVYTVTDPLFKVVDGKKKPKNIAHISATAF